MRKATLMLSLVMALLFSTTASVRAAHYSLGSEASYAQLAKKARHVALHGGITGTCKGCATHQMQSLLRGLYVEKFAKAGSYALRTALCIVKAESGFNPGAISDTGDYGSLQANKSAHGGTHPEWFNRGRGFSRLIFDPAYGVGVFWSMSSHGRDFGPWTGTYGQGLCH